MTREELNQTKQEEIFNEERREKRKHLVMIFLKITLILILIFLSAFFYITYISTSSLIVKEQRIINEKIPASFNGMKIVQFSDLHYGTTVFQSEVKNLVKQINERNPDLVVFTGDLIDQNYNLKSKERESLITELKKIKASLGKYAIMGEEDGDDFITIFNQSNFTILNNDYELIYKNDNTPILLIGLSSTLKEEIDIENDNIDTEKLEGNIEFKHVKFGYDEEKTVINDFNCSVKKGQKIAIVGPTGAGKTTMVKLLMRFYDVTSGEILVDGHNVKDFKRGNI